MDEIPEFISDEVLEVGAVQYDFDVRGRKVRCVNCHKIVETTPKKLKEFLKFHREHGTLEFAKQWHFRIPFLKKEIAIVLWNVTKPSIPKVFMR